MVPLLLYAQDEVGAVTKAPTPQPATIYGTYLSDMTGKVSPREAKAKLACSALA